MNEVKIPEGTIVGMIPEKYLPQEEPAKKSSTRK